MSPDTLEALALPDFRFPAHAIAGFRTGSALTGRWLARLSHVGEQVWCQHDTPFGHPGPVIVQLHAEAAPSLAESAVGVPINYAQRIEDGIRCGFRPEGKLLKGLDGRVACGFIERTWVDRAGVVGIIALWRDQVQADLRLLEDLDALGCAQICLGFSADYSLTRGPWGLPVAHVVAGRVFSAEFTALTHALGSRVVRQLALDEEPAEDEIIPSDRRVLVGWWSGLAPAAERLFLTADVVGGAIDTPQIVADAISNADAATDSSHTTAGASEEVVLTITVSGTGGYCVIDAKVQSTCPHGTQYTYRIRKGTTVGGTQLDITALSEAGNVGDSWNGSSVLMAKDASPGTSQAYVLTAESNAGAHTLVNAIIKGERFKK